MIEGPDSDGECTYDNSEGDHVGSTSQDDNGDPHGTIAGLLMFCADPKPAPSVDPDAYTCVWTTDDVPTLVGIVKRPSHVVMLVSLISGTTPTAKELALMTSWLKTAR